MKIALYARVSTDDKGQDPENQLAPMRAAALQEGHEVAHEYVDQLSAFDPKKKRPEFDAMLLECQARPRPFDAVWCWNLDRFTRQGTLPTLKLIEQLDALGVQFRSHTERWLDTAGPFKDAIIGFLAAINRLESQKRSERLKAKYARMRANGESIGGKNRMTDNARAELEAHVRKLRSEGLSIRAIAAQVTYRTKKGLERQISVGRVHDILKNKPTEQNTPVQGETAEATMNPTPSGGELPPSNSQGEPPGEPASGPVPADSTPPAPNSDEQPQVNAP